MFLSNLILLGLVLNVTASQCRQNSGVYHFSFGDVNGTVLSDGPVIFSQNPFRVSDEELQRSYSASFRDSSPLVLPQNIVVLDTPEGRLIVDPGSRGVQAVSLFAEAGQLFKNLRAAGITPNSIDYVLLTHGHSDHVEGLVKSDGTRAFRRATVYVGRREHDFWTTEPLPIQGNPFFAGFAESYRKIAAVYGDRIHLVSGTQIPLEGIQFIPTPGHSPGHNAISVMSQGETLIISGDTWMSKPDQLQNPEWIVNTEANTANAFDSRVRLLKKAARGRDLVLAYHEQFPGLGRVSRKGDSFDWIPAPIEQLGTGVRQLCSAGK